MGILEFLTGNGTQQHINEIEKAVQQEQWQNQFLQEAMRELELSMREEGWQRLTTSIEQDFTRSGLDQLIEISQAMFLSHPLIKRAVNVRAYYTWGQGIQIASDDDAIQEKIINPMLKDNGNRVEFFSHQARILTDIDQQTTGNTFMALFTDRNDGSVSLRSVPPQQVRDIITDPNDRNSRWLYLREWHSREFDISTGRTSEKSNRAYYPDIHFRPSSQPSTIGGIPVKWNAPIVHLRTGGLKYMSFGAPEVYAALDWARAYRKFLEDWHTIVSSLARFAWKMTAGASGIAESQQRIEGGEFDLGTEDSPLPGSLFIGHEDQDLAPIPKTGAHTSAEDAKPSRLMVGAATDLPDPFLSGDPAQGTLATAKTLDRPTELAIKSRQQMWGDFITDIIKYSVEAKREWGGVSANADIEDSLDISFPEVLEHDARSTVRAIVGAATLEGREYAGTIPRERLSRLLLQALGVEDVSSALDQLNNEQRNELEDQVEELNRRLAEKE